MPLINAHRCASSAYCAKKSSHSLPIDCHFWQKNFAPFFQIPGPRAPVDQCRCRICHRISLNNSPDMLCCSQCINPFPTQKCFSQFLWPISLTNATFPSEQSLMRYNTKKHTGENPNKFNECNYSSIT